MGGADRGRAREKRDGEEEGQRTGGDGLDKAAALHSEFSFA